MCSREHKNVRVVAPIGSRTLRSSYAAHENAQAFSLQRRGAMARPSDGNPSPLQDRVASAVTHWAGRPGAILLAAAVIVVWAALGPVFHFSDTWQLVINTGTTIVTFLMVFLLQHTQNKDTLAIHTKLDELIRAVHGARNSLAGIEDKTEDQISQVKQAIDAPKPRRRA